ncbi:B-cell receptor CD22-like isoform X2 [Synchiropus splendidus]|uniref:B-cell receptor CD22-like isoform X2 n=1 Tax=Synchiropus splendidus TaxID=270530 RepID=UPI00237D46AD|nr:B-cell receptor CD22-like isoform X2 [Synchiropus splendidus]
MRVLNVFLLNVFYLSAASAQRPLLVGLPSKMEALSDSCLQIPCNYTFTDNLVLNSPLNGVWMINDVRFEQHPENVIYNGSLRKFPMEFNGNLSEGNCSTLFSNMKKIYSNTYYFRIESETGRATDRFRPLQVTVNDMIDPGEQKENNTITITCTALTPCPQSPPTLTWNLPRQPEITRHQNKDGTFTSKIQHAITLSDHHDGLTIQCKASYPVNIGNGVKLSDRNLTLRVLFAPKNTMVRVSPSTVVSAGTFVNLSCSSRANPPVSLFTWFWISSEGAVNVSVGDLFTVNVTERQEYFCEARNQLGPGTSQRITLTIPEQIHWWIILGGIAAITAFIFIGVYLWCLNSAQKRSPLIQSERAEDSPAAETHEIQYGEIDFSKQKVDQTTSESGQEQEQHTVYAQVNVRK